MVSDIRRQDKLNFNTNQTTYLGVDGREEEVTVDGRVVAGERLEMGGTMDVDGATEITGTLLSISCIFT